MVTKQLDGIIERSVLIYKVLLEVKDFSKVESWDGNERRKEHLF